MFLNDTKEDKLNNIQTKKEPKQPMLNIFFKNNKKEKINKKSLITKTPKSSKFNSSFNFNYQKKESEHNSKEKNVTPIKKLKKNRYILNNGESKNNNNDLDSNNKNNKYNEKKNKNKFNNSHLYESRNMSNKTNNKNCVSISINNNSLFPTLNGNANLFRLNKQSNTHDENLLDEKNKQNDTVYNNINLKNFNSNSIIVTEPRQKKFTFFQKFLNDKISSHKSVNFNFVNSYKKLNSEESYLKQLSNLKINISENKNNESDKIKNNFLNSFNNKSLNEKNEFDKKINKAKSVKFNNIRNNNIYNNKPILTENYPEINIKKEFLSLIPRNNPKNLKSVIKAFTQDKSINFKKNKNNRKIFLMKNNMMNENDTIKNHIIRPLKPDIQKNSYSINNENLNSINFNNKDINNPFDRYNINNDNSINNGGDNENFDNLKKLIILNSKRAHYEGNKFVKKNEEKYFLDKRLKIFGKFHEENKLRENYISSNKNNFLKKSVIDKINKNISEHFEIILKIKEEKKKEKLKKMQKYLMQIFYFILDKPNENHPYENIDNLGLFFFIDKPIETKIKILNNSGFFDMYQDLIKDMNDKWNNDNMLIYKQLCDFYSFNYILNEKNKKNNSSFFEISDRKFFLYKEKIRKDFNFDFQSVKFTNINTNGNKMSIKQKNDKLNKRNVVKKIRKNNFPKSKTFYISNKNLDKITKINESNNNNESLNLEEKYDDELKISIFAKIQKEFTPIRQTPSQKTLIHFNKISTKKSKKKINLVNIINNNNINNINNNNSKEENKLETEFNEITKKVENYNTLKNIGVFSVKEKKKDLNEKEQLKKLMKNFKMVEIIKKLTGKEILDDLDEEILSSQEKEKEIEMEQELPTVKLFNEFVSILKKKEIDKFYILLQNNEKTFNEIINLREYKTGNTLLIYATENNLKSITELLLVKKADPDIQNKHGNSALHIAYQNNNTFIINLLIEYCANQNLKNINGFIPQEMN